MPCTMTYTTRQRNSTKSSPMVPSTAFITSPSEKNDDISQNIGKCFSMLYGKGKENEEYASLGSELWSGVLEEVEEIIRKYEFVGMKK